VLEEVLETLVRVRASVKGEGESED